MNTLVMLLPIISKREKKNASKNFFMRAEINKENIGGGVLELLQPHG